MAKILNANLGKNDRVVVHLFGRVIDVTDKLKDGEADINIYGKDYKVRIQDGKDTDGVPQTRRSKKTRK